MGSHNTTGNDGSSSGVGNIGGAVVAIINASKKDKKGFSPFDAPTRALKTQQILDATNRKIAEQVRLGNPVSERDLKRVDTLNDRLDKIEKLFEKQKKNKPKGFLKRGIDPTTATLASVIEFIAGTSRGQKIIAQHSSPIFNPAPLPTSQGVSTVPFVVTPAASTQTSFGGFGDIVNSLIGAAGQIVPAILGSKQPQSGFQQTSAGALIPAFGGAVGSLLPKIGPFLGGVGSGAVGGELADALQGLFTSGGASSQSDMAAFTDAVPGSCRPKEHLKVNPCTGKSTWFTPRGRPLVFSGDMAACKRVDRVSKRLIKSMPTKPHRHTVRSRKR